MDVTRAHRLDMPERTLWLSPNELLDALSLMPGEVVADIGAGTGHFSLPLARYSSGGRLYAIDVQDQMLAILREKLIENPISNLELVHADATATTLVAASCSLVFMANVWHEFEQRSAVLLESFANS